MITPFYYKSKLAFHLGLKERENGSFDILTNIPKQILDANYWAISKLALEQSLINRSKEQYLKAVADIILNDVQAHSFFYSNFIDTPEIEIRKSFNEITNCKSNLIMLPNAVYSTFNEPTRFYILCTLYISTKMFQAEFFNKNFPSIDRKTFENAITNIESQRLYVHFYDKTNEFKLIDDSEFNVYFLLKNEIAKMVIVQHV